MHRITSKIILEVRSIAEALKYTPMYLSNNLTAEGIESMIKAARTFVMADTDSTRLLAALWIFEAHLFFLSTIPESALNQYPAFSTRVGKITALLGSREEWEERCNMEFKDNNQPEAA